ncbi:hypothetical protein ACROYT_G017091 [Oculina patagonica]
MLLAVISFVCNTLVCITVARTKSLQHPSMLMLCSLAITDLTYSLLSLFKNTETLTHQYMCASVNHEITALGILCKLATLGTLAAISKDRYLAVTKPWWYRDHVTKSRAIKVAFVVWCISAAITLVIYIAFKFEAAYMPLALMPLVLNPLLNFGRSKDMRRALRVLLRCSNQVQQASGAYASQQQQQQEQQQQQQDQQQQRQQQDQQQQQRQQHLTTLKASEAATIITATSSL